MKYTYVYKTSDGVRHEAMMVAKCRDDVFIELRKQGIRAIKVIAADGSKANGELHGVRKRVVVSIVLAVALTVGLVAWFAGLRSGVNAVALTGEVFQTDQTRRQVIGDLAVIEKGIRNGWSDVFELEGERFLASFAIPGVKAGKRNTNEQEFRLALESQCKVAPDDSIEVLQIKSMVEGMKAEARKYLAAGGNIIEYGKRLTERQDAEIAIYTRVKIDLEKARKTMSEDAFMLYSENRNDELRNLGIKTIFLTD